MSKRYQGGVLGVGFNPLRAPNAPTVGTATAGGNNCASVAFTAPSCVGGSAVTGYTAQSNPTGYSGAAAGSPITVSGLTNGQSYTFGVFALNSYGPSPISAFSNSITAALDGTLGIFALGCGASAGTIRNKYTYAGCVVSAGGAATVASRSGAAAGNSTVGIFALGCDTLGTSITTRDKYTYSGCVVSAGGAATAASYSGSAAGNSTVGIFALGFTTSASTTRNKYTYSGCVVGSATSATASGYGLASTGNSSVGIFALGSGATARNKYTYSGDTNASTTVSTAGTFWGSAAGNSTIGIFVLGSNSVTRNKYTYSGDTNASAGAATASSQMGAAAGNSTIGIFALGYAYSGSPCCGNINSTTRNKYTYSGCVVTAGGAATIASSRGSATSNGIAGITL